jgi:type IV pilus assembly protein PilM
MKSLIGISLSDSTIEAIELSGRRKKFNIEAFSRIKVKPGVIVNSEIIAVPDFVVHIKKLLENPRPKSFSSRSVALSLPQSVGLTHIIYAPKELENDELEKYLTNEISSIVPYQLFELYWNYQVIGIEEGKKMIIWNGGLRKIINQYLKVFESLKYKVEFVELESNSAFRIYVDEVKKNEAVALIDLGSTTDNICIYDDRGLIFSYAYRSGGDFLTQKIAQAKNLSLEEAEALKIRSGLNGESKKQNLTMLFLREMSAIVEETRKAIGFYEKLAKRKVTQIIMTGGGSNFRKINDYFFQNLDVETVISKAVINLTGPKINSSYYAVGLGLSLLGASEYSSKCLNLLPAQSIKTDKTENFAKQKKIKEALILLFVIIFGAVGITGAYLYRLNEKEKQQMSLAELLRPAALPQVNSLNLDYKILVVDSLADSSSPFVGRLLEGELEKTESFGVTGRKIIASQQVSVLSEDDLTRAENAIIQKIEYDFLVEKLKDSVSLGEVLLSDAVKMEKTESFANADVGAVISSFNYTVKARITGLIIKEEDLVKSAQENLALRLGLPTAPENYDFGNFIIEITGYNPQTKQTELGIKVVATKK